MEYTHSLAWPSGEGFELGPYGDPFLRWGTLEHYAGFVDFGYLRAAGAKALGKQTKTVRPLAEGVVTWFRSLPTAGLDYLGVFLRVYWYDGQLDPIHENYTNQRKFFDAIASTPGLQLRAGHLGKVLPAGRSK